MSTIASHSPSDISEAVVTDRQTDRHFDSKYRVYAYIALVKLNNGRN